jgi:hypothetical protein
LFSCVGVIFRPLRVLVLCRLSVFSFRVVFCCFRTHARAANKPNSGSKRKKEQQQTLAPCLRETRRSVEAGARRCGWRACRRVSPDNRGRHAAQGAAASLFVTTPRTASSRSSCALSTSTGCLSAGSRCRISHTALTNSSAGEASFRCDPASCGKSRGLSLRCTSFKYLRGIGVCWSRCWCCCVAAAAAAAAAVVVVVAAAVVVVVRCPRPPYPNERTERTLTNAHTTRRVRRLRYRLS